VKTRRVDPAELERFSMRAKVVLALLVSAVSFMSARSGQRPFDQLPLGRLHMQGHVPPGVGGAPAGVPAPTRPDEKTIAEVKAFEQACEDANVRGDRIFLERALADDFIMTSGDGWTVGQPPIEVATKRSWIEYIGRQPPPYFYRKLDAVQVELHGDVAITIGKYRYLQRSGRADAPNTTGTHLYVWFERVYARRNGQWQFLSHRTVNGPGREYDSSGTGSGLIK
jgi:hypothetical protein